MPCKEQGTGEGTRKVIEDASCAGGTWGLAAGVFPRAGSMYRRPWCTAPLHTSGGFTEAGLSGFS